MHAAHAVQRNQSYSACHGKVPDLHLYLPPPSFSLLPSPSPVFLSPAASPRIALSPLCFLKAGIQKHVLGDLATCFVTWG